MIKDLQVGPIVHHYFSFLKYYYNNIVKIDKAFHAFQASIYTKKTETWTLQLLTYPAKCLIYRTRDFLGR